MKKCLPDTTKVSKDAKECVQECTSEFISFITSEAAERCAVEKRKTINGEDILFAMSTLGFEMYAEVMKVYLAKYREHQRSTGKRAQKRAAKEAAARAATMAHMTGNGDYDVSAVYDEDDGESDGDSDG
ncbi:histone-fold-containing protein [Rhodotorula diobovata]|uniref:Histone-fold-containing protein n=1 Tax=Rhodotorula diobovata TaxID=5288 RepID=A0A5C5G0J6_9BASI|nr:histone-fold-containing protein [Rhodotorula diobovata]